MQSEQQRHAEGKPFRWEHVLAPNFLDDPYALTEEVLQSCPPLFFAGSVHPRMGDRVWVATRYSVINEILSNSERYSSTANYPYFRLIGEDLQAIPLQFDPPEHDRYRKFLDPWFSPRAVRALEPSILATVTQLIDGFVDAGECDASYDFSRVYPVRVFMHLMGFPPEAFEDFLSWSHPMHFETDNPERMAWGTRGALAYLRAFIDEVRKAPPNDTLASKIVHGRIEGQDLTDKEILGMIFFLWDGGMDTVAATSSLIFGRLALDPELQQQLRDSVERIPNAIEEFLRMFPTVNTARMAKVDHELAGQQIKAGDRLLCLIASGNYDTDKFKDPRTFRLDRGQNRHLTFVTGPHRCLGMNLARFEMRIAFTEFLRRIPPFRLRPNFRCEATPGLRGAPHVPIVWFA